MKNFVDSSAIAVPALIFFAITGLLKADKIEVPDPVNEYALELARHYNPADASDAEVLQLIRLIRFKADFNADGLQDIAVSESTGWGNAGGEWQLYLKSPDGQYTVFKESIFFHPLAINIKAIKKGLAKITHYTRENIGQGYLITSNLSNNDFKRVSIKTMKPQGNSKDEKEYQKLFGRLYREPVSEFCMLSVYLKNKNCPWEKGY